jgi:hypothetical protein
MGADRGLQLLDGNRSIIAVHSGIYVTECAMLAEANGL